MVQAIFPGGDPQGRRLGRRRSGLLNEAGQLAYIIETLLRRADFDTDAIKALRVQIAAQEQIEHLRSFGRIESRKRFKSTTGAPIREQRPTNFLFIDEAGKSFPEPHMNESYFALGAVSMLERDIKRYQKAANAIKMHFFGDDRITFHEPYMRNRDGMYGFHGDTARQQKFDAAITKLIARTRFVAFGVGLRKTALNDILNAGLEPYLPSDVYAVATALMLERYVDYLQMSDTAYLGRVTFESQGAREDVLHQWQYAGVLMDGTQWVPESAFRNWLEAGVRFMPKIGSHPMELADLLSRDLFEWTRDGCVKKPKFWDVLSTKIYSRGDRQMGKFGVKVFPDSDIRAEILAHRAECNWKRN